MRIVIVGLGLIGGSLAGACRKVFPKSHVIGVTRNRVALAKAKKKGWIHEGYTDLKQAFKQGRFSGTHLRTAPFVILCTPVDTLKNFLLQLDRLAPARTIVTDAGSVKGFLVRWAQRRRWRRIQYVGAHPMAGSHERGIDYARPDLFKEAVTFVMPGRGPSSRTVAQFWKKISKQVVLISAEEHDRITSEISHLPHLIASALVASVSRKSLPFSANGFLDTTRIAASDPNLWAPIFQENRKELFRALATFESRLIFLKKTLKKGNRGRLKRFLEASQRRRKSL